MLGERHDQRVDQRLRCHIAGAHDPVEHPQSSFVHQLPVRVQHRRDEALAVFEVVLDRRAVPCAGQLLHLVRSTASIPCSRHQHLGRADQRLSCRVSPPASHSHPFSERRGIQTGPSGTHTPSVVLGEFHLIKSTIRHRLTRGLRSCAEVARGVRVKALAVVWVVAVACIVGAGSADAATGTKVFLRDCTLNMSGDPGPGGVPVFLRVRLWWRMRSVPHTRRQHGYGIRPEGLRRVG